MNSCSFVRRAAALLVLSTSVPAWADQAGSLDPTFDGDGKQTIAFDDLAQQGDESTNDRAWAMELAPGGRIYLAGLVRRDDDTGDQAIGLVRLKHDGSPDASFGEGGRVVHDIVAGNNGVSGSALQSDGRLIVTGSVRAYGGGSQLLACRFDTDGARDPSFGNAQTPGCHLFPEVFMTNYFGWTVLIQTDGRIVLAGVRDGRAMLARLEADGTIDTQFGDAGTYQPAGALYGRSGFIDVTQMPDGDLVATGYTNPAPEGGEFDVLLVRLDQVNGGPDLGFGPDGIKVLPISLAVAEDRRWDTATGVHALANGALLVTGYIRTDFSKEAYFSERPFALKLQPNGQYDPEFGGGIRTYDPCPPQVVDCNIQTKSSFVFDDGRFLLAGSYSTTHPEDFYSVEDFFAMRLLPNGEPDSDFGSQMPDMEGTTVFDFGPLEPQFSPGYADVVLADGERILLAGSAAKPAQGNEPFNHTDFAVARLDHGLDQTFEVSSESTGNGGLSPALHQNVGHSDHVEFDVTPAPGYQVDTIEGCGGALYGGVYTTGPIVADCTVTATFELKPDALFSDGFEPQD